MTAAVIVPNMNNQSTKVASSEVTQYLVSEQVHLASDHIPKQFESMFGLLADKTIWIPLKRMKNLELGGLRPPEPEVLKKTALTYTFAT